MPGGLEGLNLKLGKKTEEGTLDAVPRSLSRDRMAPLPTFYGYDLWNAYEVSFLLPSGKPLVFHMQASYSADSPNIVESKSFKLFLNTFNLATFENLHEFSAKIQPALSTCVGSPVSLKFFAPEESPAPKIIEAESVDHLSLNGLPGRGHEVLQTTSKGGAFSLKSHLLRSNCPVTNQPDWGTVWVRGVAEKTLDPASLLSYLVSLRNHQDFHESCCEVIYRDMHNLLKPESLEISCMYTRRGGLDINPHRFSTAKKCEVFRSPVWRQ